MPSNIPLEMKRIYAQWKRKNALDSEIEYNEVEDLRYPIDNLQFAVDLYTTRGIDAVKEYAAATRMPKKDLERVLHTAKIGQQKIIDEAESMIDGIGKKIENTKQEP